MTKVQVRVWFEKNQKFEFDLSLILGTHLLPTQKMLQFLFGSLIIFRQSSRRTTQTFLRVYSLFQTSQILFVVQLSPLGNKIGGFKQNHQKVIFISIFIDSI